MINSGTTYFLVDLGGKEWMGAGVYYENRGAWLLSLGFGVMLEY